MSTHVILGGEKIGPGQGRLRLWSRGGPAANTPPIGKGPTLKRPFGSIKMFGRNYIIMNGVSYLKMRVPDSRRKL